MKDKKGIIILTHYRSGGTLLKQVLDNILGFALKYKTEEVGEIDLIEGSYDFDTKVDYNRLLKEKFETFDKGYKIILLNNPLLISYLSAIDYFSYLNDNFYIVHLERQDIKKSILSLPLWEYKLEYLKSSAGKASKNVLDDFHNFCLKNPIHYSHVYTGIHFSTPNLSNYRNYLDYQLMLLTNRVHLNRYLQQKYNFLSIDYSDYENDPNENFFNIFKPFDIDKEQISIAVKRLKKRKIQYKSDDYIIYFDNKTKEVFNYWNL